MKSTPKRARSKGSRTRRDMARVLRWDEIRLVQGYSGLPEPLRLRVLAFVSELVVATCRPDLGAPDVVVAAQRAERSVAFAEAGAR